MSADDKVVDLMAALEASVAKASAMRAARAARFMVGETYEQRHYSDYSWIKRYTVASRTAKTVTLSGDHNGRLKIRHDDDGSEWAAFPGSISAGSIWARQPKVSP